ncbi:MAG TPA: DUF1501 domain-containing protein [Planctomycetaceae bacterium]|nr:DUF1501 domain-containing protein [Planctomycetaceae bacterium]HQZ67169.1 DUF1501 domain-containing protein [Planctomycetaceae bacterium]
MAFFRTCDGVGRRDFLKAGAVGGTGLTLASYAQLAAASNLDAAARGKSAIFVNLNGGPSHMDTFDPKPDAPSEYRGEFKTIQTCLPGVVISEHLPKIATCMDKFALLRGVSHSVAAHELGTKYVNTGNRPLPSLEFPGYGAVLTKERPSIPELPPFVAIPNSAQRPGYLGVRYAPMNTTASPQIGQPFRVRGISMSGGLTVEDVERRRNLLTQLDRTFSDVEQDSQLLEGMDEFGRQAHTVITSAKARDAFDIGKESPDFTKQFGSSSLGASCLLALRLVESGVRFVTLSNGGWDTHRDNWNVLKTKQLPALDEALFGLFTGLAARGLLDSTVVYVTGEFGRTPKINTERIGRDHYPRNMFMLLGGGGIKGGQVLGESDATASLPKGAGFSPDDVAASFYHALGIDHTHEYHTPTGRPVMIVRDGHVIPELFS